MIEVSSDLGDFPVDDGIMSTFPAGTEVVLCNRHGLSQWTITAKLQVRFPDGTMNRYFVKTSRGEAGRRLMEGEFHAITAIHDADNLFAPKPHAWGKRTGEGPETYFFILHYIDMSDRFPDPNQLCRRLAQLHRNSISPTGKFGFHINTCQGKTQQAVGWEDSWVTLFTKMLEHIAKLDHEINEHWDALDKVEARIYSHVIPRLIGALESNGRTIKPCLIHGDLWEGNTGTTFDTGNVYIFDAASYYAHNEMEIGDWRPFYNNIHNKVYTKTYLKHFAPSEPKAEWDDRNRMYSVYYNVMYSVNHGSQGTSIRQIAFDDMYFLIDKYAPFPEGEAPPKITEAERVAFPSAADHTATVFGSAESLAYAAKMREGAGASH